MNDVRNAINDKTTSTPSEAGSGADPHGNEPLLTGGVPMTEATMALVLVHGRGGSAEGMLPIARAAGASDAAQLAPRAAGQSWYPDRFLDPVAANEPYLSSALAAIGRAVQTAIDAGVPAHRIILVGFSQGACLSLEFAARNAQRYGGVAAFAGARLGDAGDVARYASVNRGTFNGTPIFLGCGNDDPHIPEARVRDSAAQLTQQGAAVDLRIYQDIGHNIVGDQLDALRAMVQHLRESPRDAPPA